jgi:hypothetical protein
MFYHGAPQAGTASARSGHGVRADLSAGDKRGWRMGFECTRAGATVRWLCVPLAAPTYIPQTSGLPGRLAGRGTGCRRGSGAGYSGERQYAVKKSEVAPLATEETLSEVAHKMAARRGVEEADKWLHFMLRGSGSGEAPSA